MEFRIAVSEFRKALHRASGVVEKKTTMPILSNVLVEAGNGGVRVTAFDLDIGLVSEHPAEVAKSGSLTLPTRHVLDVVNNLPEDSVLVRSLPNNYVELTSGASRFKLIGMSCDDYPKLPKESGATMVEVSGGVLLEMIKKTYFATSSDETRYILNGVFFEPKGEGKVRMVATDGHRLALIERELEGEFKLKGGVIIPRKGVQELKRLLDEAPDAECHLGFADNSALFKKPGLTMVMRLIDGQFPEYQRVIPKEGEKVVTVPKLRFLEALKRIALLSADKSNAVKVGLSDNILRVASSNPDLGEAKDEFEVGYKGGELAIGFNARYIIDVLSAVEGDEVVLEFGDEHSPGVIYLPGNRTYTAVVMPMRV